MLKLLPILVSRLAVFNRYLSIMDRVPTYTHKLQHSTLTFCRSFHRLLLSAHCGQDLLIYEVLILVHCCPVRWSSPHFRLLRGRYDLAPGWRSILTRCLQVLSRCRLTICVFFWNNTRLRCYMRLGNYRLHFGVLDLLNNCAAQVPLGNLLLLAGW